MNVYTQNGLSLMAILFALAGSLVFGTNLANAMSGDYGRYQEHHGAPGPIAGAGLPILAVGYGVYWLIKTPSQGGIAPLLSPPQTA